jgi:hypothetical protein
MNLGGLTHALRGINGGFEINRLISGVGGLAYIIGAHVFVGYEVLWLGHSFDITAYCLAFPGGLAALLTGTAGAVAIKDRNVASAAVTAATGTVPTPAPDGPQVPAGTDVTASAGGAQEQEVDLAP